MHSHAFIDWIDIYQVYPEGGLAFIANTLIENINAAFSVGATAEANGIPIGYLAYTMFRLCGGFDAILMIVAAYTTKYSLLGLHVFLRRLN